VSRRKLLVLLGSGLVVVQLLLVVGVWIPVPHNGGDNAGYVSLAHSLLSGEGYVEAWDPARPLHTKYPPLFPALLAAAIALGARTWTALKLVPAAFTTVAVVGTFLWAARRRGPWFGAGVAALLAAGPGLLWYSHWVLSDVPFLALTVLALWALEHGSPGEVARDGEGAGPPAAGGDGGAPGSKGTVPRVAAVWLGAGMVAAVLAYFTRSAGLPLLLAVAGWLAFRRRWAPLGVFAAVAGAPALAWWLRGRGGGTDYVAEFWMVDPYAPERGTIGPGGLVGRAADNLGLYLTGHVPEGLMGRAPGATIIGLAVLALAVVGWGRLWLPAGRWGRVHAAELFFPLYAGLILLWPQVWSGDRFALPLFPLVLFYAGDALLRLARRLSVRVVPGAGLAGLLLVGAPALLSWGDAREEARACGSVSRSIGAGPWSCWGAPWEAFVDAARWSGANLREGSAVLTRKPRIFWVMGGTPGRTYPFTADPDRFLSFADEAGARYVLLDALGRQGPVYVGGVVRALPGAFCSVAPFRGGGGGEGRASAQLLGIVDPALEAGGALERGPEGPALRIPTCPGALLPAGRPVAPPPPGRTIPLLAR
jgi:hypothetical protein